MPSSTLEPRLVGALLAVGWAVVAALVLASATSGWLVLLALGALLPGALAALVALEPRPGPGTGAGARLAGLLAVLLTVGLLWLIAEPVLAPERSPLVPSTGIGYGGLLALVATIVYCNRWSGGWQVGRRLAPLVGAVSVLVGGVAFALAGTAGGAPAACSVPPPADEASVEVAARAEIDGTSVGRVRLVGERVGRDAYWTADVAVGVVGGSAGAYDLVRVGERGWLRRDGGEWRELPATDGAGAGAGVLDERLIGDLARQPPAAVDDLGIELVAGTPARHCRVAVDGTTAIGAFPPLAWLVGVEPPSADPPPRARLDIWRGELDWWIASDGRLVRASAIVGGLPAHAWGVAGAHARLLAEMSVGEPASSPTIEEPLR